MCNTSYPIAATDTKVTIRSLAANWPDYSVPLTAAVTHTSSMKYLSWRGQTISDLNKYILKGPSISIQCLVHKVLYCLDLSLYEAAALKVV